MVINKQIRPVPAQNKNIKALIKWTRDKIRFRINPDLKRFLAVNASDFIKRYKHHEAYIKNSKTITERPKPEEFTNKVKWV